MSPFDAEAGFGHTSPVGGLVVEVCPLLTLKQVSDTFPAASLVQRKVSFIALKQVSDIP